MRLAINGVKDREPLLGHSQARSAQLRLEVDHGVHATMSNSYLE